MCPETFEFALLSRGTWVGLFVAPASVLLGFWLLLAPASNLGMRVGGLVLVPTAVHAAWTYARNSRRTNVALSVDAWGMRSRHLRPNERYGTPWGDVAALRVQDDLRESFVVVTFYAAAPLSTLATASWARSEGGPPPDAIPEYVLSPLELGATTAAFGEQIACFQLA